MSLLAEPNYNDYIDRLVLILRNSAILFPNKVGGNSNAEDLVRQVIKYDLAIAQDVPTGLGPPHIFVSVARNPIVSDDQSGKDNQNQVGPRELKLEFWIVCVTNEPEYAAAQESLYNITNAVSRTLYGNKRLKDTTNANPLCREIDKLIVTPFTDWQSTEKTVLASTVIVRPKIMVNNRTDF